MRAVIAFSLGLLLVACQPDGDQPGYDPRDRNPLTGTGGVSTAPPSSGSSSNGTVAPGSSSASFGSPPDVSRVSLEPPNSLRLSHLTSSDGEDICGTYRSRILGIRTSSSYVRSACTLSAVAMASIQPDENDCSETRSTCISDASIEDVAISCFVAVDCEGTISMLEDCMTAFVEQLEHVRSVGSDLSCVDAGEGIWGSAPTAALTELFTDPWTVEGGPCELLREECPSVVLR